MKEARAINTSCASIHEAQKLQTKNNWRERWLKTKSKNFSDNAAHFDFCFFPTDTPLLFERIPFKKAFNKLAMVLSIWSDSLKPPQRR